MPASLAATAAEPFAVARRFPRVLDGVALAAGAAQAAAFAPFEWRALAVLGPALLFLSWRASSPARALWRGWLYGLGLFGAGVYWIFYSLHLFGDAIAPLAAFLTAGFVAGMALYPGLAGYLVRRLARGGGPLAEFLLVAPCVWVLAEWLRAWFLTGFPWLLLGHSQVDGPLAGYLPLGGTFAASWALALSAGALACGLSVRRTRLRVLLLAGLALLWIGGQAARAIDSSQPSGAPLRVRIVQGNVEQHVKFIAQMLQPAIDRYTALSGDGGDVDLVVWPETAIPTFYHRVADQLEPLAARLAAKGTDLAIGVLEYRQATRQYHNAVRRVGPHAPPGGAPAAYYKRHLVPFGEYMPLRGWLEFLADYIIIPMSDIAAGSAAQPPLLLAGRRVAVSICYEDAFGEEVIAQLPEAELLLNVSNDAWFGDSGAPPQHLEIARVRAVETQRPMVRATNTGISALIGHDGRILARAPQFEAHAFSGTLQPRTGATPYVRWGNYPVLAGLGLALLASLALQRRSRSSA